MKMDEIRAVAARQGIKAGKMKKEDLIRSIQREEGNETCFACGKAAECGQEACLWRDDCA
jgi:hypothetical protein